MSKNGKEAVTTPAPLASWRMSPENDGWSVGRFVAIVLAFSLAAILAQIVAHLNHYTDYIGPDPDDSMRLVEVRDWLNGQGWFDLHQYRLGPPGGTLMHWSRFIDAPIGLLILFFQQFLSPDLAERAATFTWPLLLVAPLMAGMGLAGYRLGGPRAAPLTLILAFLFLFAMIRFRPGALDHHNAQLVIAAFLAAMLMDPLARFSNFAVAGALGALALAIGAETTPLIGVAAVAVALSWAMIGQRYRQAAMGFGFAFALAAILLFFVTTPPAFYTNVTCDTLSVGYLSLAVTGGIGLGVVAALGGNWRPLQRWLGLGAVGLLVGLTAILVAPQCLGNPLSNLDPLLKTLWLGSITEAQPISKQFEINPESVGGIYAVGLLALGVCLLRLRQRQESLPHALLFGLIAISWIVSAIQVRGMIFSNLLAALPLSVLVADLRSYYLEHRSEPRAAIAFIVVALASVPSIWTFAGVLGFQMAHSVLGIKNVSNDEKDADELACVRGETLKTIATLPPGRMLASFNDGPMILRYTPHAVLAANYHRNQRGMLDALHIETSDPAIADKLMRQDKVGYVLLCADDNQVESLKPLYPNGFLARLARGEIPEFLEPVAVGNEPRMKFFKLVR